MGVLRGDQGGLRTDSVPSAALPGAGAAWGVWGVCGVCVGSGVGTGGTRLLCSDVAGVSVSRGSCREVARTGQLKTREIYSLRSHGLEVQGQGAARAGGGSDTVRKALPAAGRAVGPGPSSGPGPPTPRPSACALVFAWQTRWD